MFHVKRFDYDFNRGDPINVPLRWEFVETAAASTGSSASSSTTAAVRRGPLRGVRPVRPVMVPVHDDRIVEATNVKEEALPNAYMLFYGLTSLHAPTQIQPRAVRRR